MKNVLFVINNLKIGGVQSSLLNLVKELKNQYNVTVLTFSKNAVDEKKLPADVRCITASPIMKYLGVSQRELKRYPFLFALRAFFAILARIFGRSSVLKLMFLFQKKIGVFDYAVSFLHEGSQDKLYGGCNEFVLKKVIANKKIAWVHGDFEQCGANCKRNIGIYKCFDQIVACSEGARTALIKCVPEFAQKCVAVRNCNDFAQIKQLAGAGMKFDESRFNIVTVSRLGAEKGIDRAIVAILECIKRGQPVQYHIVGDGIMKKKLQALCREHRVEKYVIFYGNQVNPYWYIKNADLFLLPSYQEAAPMVFDESACLGVPVLATKTISTKEMIEQTNSGVVCENSQDGIVNALLSLLNDKDRLTHIRENLKNRTFTNESIRSALEREVLN